MNQQGLSAWAIRRPIPTIVLFLVLTLAGIAAFLRLPVNANPAVSLPMVSVSIGQAGAVPVEMERAITRKVENALAGLPGVRHVQSSVQAGQSDTTVEFRLGTDTDRAVNDVRAAIGQMRGDLPQTIFEPVIQRVDIEGGAMLQFVVTAPSRSPASVTTFVDDVISRELLAVSGVQRISRFGGVEREIRVEPYLDRLAHYGLSVADLNRQLLRNHAEAPGGYVDRHGLRQVIRIPGRSSSLSQLQRLPIALSNGQHLPLGELGRVHEGLKAQSGFAELGGQAVVGFMLWRSKGASDTEVDGRVTAQLERLAAAYPDIRVRQVASTVEYTRASYETAMQTLIEGALLTVAVVFLFLRDWRATLISALALPLSILPVFIAMLWLDFTLNSITLLALTLVIGILVDDAIVEIENIERHIHMGERPLLAALNAADGIALAVLATTLTIVAVFAPVGFISGVVGQYFQQFGLTASIAVLASLLVARLLTPLLAAYFMQPKHLSVQQQSNGRWMTRYLQLLAWTLAHRRLTLLGMALPFVLAVVLATQLPSGFLPVNDSNLSQLRITLPPGRSPEEARHLASEVGRMLQKQADVAHVLMTAQSPAEALIAITLKPRGVRERSRKAFEQAMLSKLTAMPDRRYLFLSDGGTPEVSVMLGGMDAAQLAGVARELERQASGLPMLANVQLTLAAPRSEILIVPRPAEAARLGVSSADIAETVRIASNGEVDAESAVFQSGDKSLPLRVSLNREEASQLASLRALRVQTLAGDSTVALAAVTDIRFAEGESRIDRFDRQRRVALEANLASGSLGEALSAIYALPVMQALPAGVVRIDYGEAEYMDEMFANFSMAMAAGILAMLAILILLFRDFLQPITILSTLPLSLIGAIPALWLIGAALDLPAIIGILMLMGIVTKNAILLLDFTLDGMAQGQTRQQALLAACETRARPIIMTTVAMIAGMLPAVIGIGADAGFRVPMAATVIGGLLTSTLLSLLCVPVIFSYLDDLRGWLAPRLARLSSVTAADKAAAGI